MRLYELFEETSSSDAAEMMSLIREKIPTVTRADARVLDYLNEIGIELAIFAPQYPTVIAYYQIVTDSAYKTPTDKFRKKIRNVAMMIKSRGRKNISGRDYPSYQEAISVINQHEVGKKGIAQLTNETDWKLVGYAYGQDRYP